VTAQPPDWDEYGERIVATDVCIHCREAIDQWEIRVDPSLGIQRPVLLWKHHSDGAVMCGPAEAATPLGGPRKPTD
jgi:hypothetical protein